MAWTKSGTISLTNGSAVVFGSGTTWASAGKARAGDILKAPDGKDYEVLSVQSNTQLTLASVYLGSTASGQAYALIHTGLLPSELATGLSDLQSKYLTTISQLYEWETSTADTVPITNPATGVTSNVKPLARFLGSLTDGSVAGNFSTLSASGRLTTAGITEDGAGNIGLGVTPSAWSGYRAIQMGFGASFATPTDGLTAQLLQNGFYNGSNWVYINSGLGATHYEQGGSSHRWYSAPSGTANQPIGFTQAMTLDANGNLLVGTLSGSYHVMKKSVTNDAGNVIMETQGNGTTSLLSCAVTGWGVSSTNSATKVAKDGITGRSINAGGTINASGADYAEYERNGGLSIIKGQVVGFKFDGTLTLIFAEAIRFGVKSTDPSYVGGDVWGTEDQVGKRPDEPVYKVPDYTGPEMPVEPALDADADAYFSAVNRYQVELESYAVAQADYRAQIASAQSAHEEAMIEYAAKKAEFEERLESARQTVDRIAYAGKVPCNVLNAAAGGYIIAAEDDAGLIVGEFVSDPDFAQYKKAVGRVNRILDDGRCEIAVIVH